MSEKTRVLFSVEIAINVKCLVEVLCFTVYSWQTDSVMSLCILFESCWWRTREGFNRFENYSQGL